MDEGVTLRPPPVCTGRGGRWCTHGVGTAYAPCSPVGLHAPCLGASLMASCLSPTGKSGLQQTKKIRGWEVRLSRASAADCAGLCSAPTAAASVCDWSRTSREVQRFVRMADCFTRRFLWYFRPWQVSRQTVDRRWENCSVSVSGIICSFFPSVRAVGVAALPCPGGQVAWCSRRHSSSL